MDIATLDSWSPKRSRMSLQIFAWEYHASGTLSWESGTFGIEDSQMPREGSSQMARRDCLQRHNGYALMSRLGQALIPGIGTKLVPGPTPSGAHKPMDSTVEVGLVVSCVQPVTRQDGLSLN